MTVPPSIFVLAGVNGSGKSSIGGAIIQAKGNDYYNPDEAARKLMSIHPNMIQHTANGHAWLLGKTMLEEAIDEKKTFAFETTLGGNTITRLLIKGASNGLHLHLWYAGLESVELNIKRVQSRVSTGGHPIPEEQIRKRWNTSRRNIIRLMPHLQSLKLYDNSFEADPKSGLKPEPKLLLSISDKTIRETAHPKHVPDWAKPIIEAAFRLNQPS